MEAVEKDRLTALDAEKNILLFFVFCKRGGTMERRNVATKG